MLSLQKWLSETRTCSALLLEFRVPAGWREQSRQEAGMDTLCGGGAEAASMGCWEEEIIKIQRKEEMLDKVN